MPIRLFLLIQWEKCGMSCEKKIKNIVILTDNYPKKLLDDLMPNCYETVFLRGKFMSPKKYFHYNENRTWTEHMQIVAQLGLTMAGSILFCFFVGRLLDGWLGFRGIFTSLFIILGIIGGAVVVYRQIMEITEADENGNKKDGERKG